MDTILITGGTGKIGGQLVRHFLRDGWRVFFTTRRVDAVELLRLRFDLQPPELENLFPVSVDLLAETAIDKVMAAVEGQEINVLVNNARSLESLKINPNGISERKHLMDEYLMDVVVPYELATRFEESHPLRHVINVGSIYGVVPFNPNLYDNYEQSAPIQYSLSKAAVNQLTRELAIRFRGRCQVNTVSFGGVEGRVDEAFRERYADLCPEGVMLTEEQTVGPVAFLASAGSRGVTGHNLIQDGGWTVW